MWLVGVWVAAALLPVALGVDKCCAVGEALLADSLLCLPYRSNDTWLPKLVYSAEIRGFLSEEDFPDTWTIRHGVIPSCDRKVLETTAHALSPPYILIADGSLFLAETEAMVAEGRYCLDHNIAVVCVDESSSDASLEVRKCCGNGGVYSEETGACVTASSFEGVANLVDAHLDGSNASVIFVSGFPQCDRRTASSFKLVGTLDTSAKDLKPDGSVHLRQAAATLKPGEFCIEEVKETKRIEVFTCPEYLERGTYHRPAPPSPDESDLRFILYPSCLFISVLFLAATLAISYLLTGSHLHVVHWQCQTCYVGCLMMGDFFLAITHVSGEGLRGPVCKAVASFMHFFFLCAFFWLNTMCFNIWWTFRDLRPMGLDRGQEVARLRVYHLYAWGCSIVAGGLALIADSLPQISDDSVFKPKFGHVKCWFYGDKEILLYFYGPIGVLLTINLILFGATARALTCGLWKNEVVKSSSERATLWRVCMKLVVVMGLTWLVDVISWAAGGPKEVWYIVDMLNALQGLLIFGVVVSQPQVASAINKMWCLKQCQQTTTADTAPQVSSCSPMASTGDSMLNTLTTSRGSSQMETLC